MLILMALIGFFYQVFITLLLMRVTIAIAILPAWFGLRFIAGVIWGYDPQTLESALIGTYYNFGELVISMTRSMSLLH